jgi:hypothetical protein
MIYRNALNIDLFSLVIEFELKIEWIFGVYQGKLSRYGDFNKLAEFIGPCDPEKTRMVRSWMMNCT